MYICNIQQSAYQSLEAFGFRLINQTNFEIQEIQWSESKGSAADDGFTTELVAVKGKAIVSGKTEYFSFMVKQTPEIAGRRLNMCMEVTHKQCSHLRKLGKQVQ